MTGSSPAAGMCRAEIQDLAWELARTSGALSEIETCWRRSLPGVPGLPLTLPLRLRDTARQIEEDARCLATAGPAMAAALATDIAERFASYQHDIATAQAMTCAPGSTSAGDEMLWDSVARALRRASGSLLSLIVHQVTVTGWSVTPTQVDGGQVMLCLTLDGGAPREE